MKNFKLFLLFSFATAMVSCDVIEGPYVDPNFNGVDTSAQARKILLEDYTGATCSNCPDAAEQADAIAHQFPGRVIVLGVHAGFFAEPKPPTYTDDFRNPTSTAWDNFFGISAVGNPNGMVNRLDYPNSQHVKSFPSWASICGQELAKETDLTIGINPSYIEGSRQLTIDVAVTSLDNLDDGPYHLFVGIREDSIISPQKSTTETGATIDVLDYVHMHMLREGVTPPFGEVIAPLNLNLGETVEKSYQITLSQDYVAKNVSVIAFVFNNNNKQVLQADYAYIK